MRQLEELNPVDDFLANSLTSHKIYGEPAARCIPEDLRQLLLYMEHSSEENAGTEALQKLHEMVTAIKKDGKVGLAYMKSFEIEARIRKEGLIEGKAEDILDLLGDLSEIPSPLREKIMAQRDESTLRTWLKYAAKAENMEDFIKRISG